MTGGANRVAEYLSKETKQSKQLYRLIVLLSITIGLQKKCVGKNKEKLQLGGNQSPV